MTAIQEKIFNYVDDYIALHGFSPSYLEISLNTGIGHGTVQKSVYALVRQGRLIRKPGKIRNLATPYAHKLQDLFDVRNYARRTMPALNMEQNLIQSMYKIEHELSRVRDQIAGFFFRGAALPPMTEEYESILKEVSSLAILTGSNLNVFLVPTPVVETIEEEEAGAA